MRIKKEILSFMLATALILFCPFDLFPEDTVPSKIRIRLFSETETDLLFFSVETGNYNMILFPGYSREIKTGETVVMMEYNGRLAIKISGSRALLADSVFFTSASGRDLFTLNLNNGSKQNYIYSGDLHCIPDMETILLINICDIEDYVAGVVKAEGGTGKSEEYFKTQAVITRTYTYRNFKRHITDRYNLCDGTHCQVYRGISADSIINSAMHHTAGRVIVDTDSILIISAFHSNCGGETSPSEYVWVISVPYLTSVKDPYCTSSPNAIWEKKVSVREWKNILTANGYTDGTENSSQFTFSQNSRTMHYTTGSFRIPFYVLRNALGLRSAWFSVYDAGDSLILKGRGYGHGVGLCQEGAMVMANKGINYEDIIKFYYPDTRIIDIRSAKMPVEIKK